MVKAKASDIKKQVKQQDEDLYQDGLRDDPESDDNTKENVEKTFGTKLDAGETFDMRKEVDDDEKARRTMPEPDED